MKVLWTNVFILVFALFALVLILRNRSDVGLTIASVRNIGTGHSPEEQVVGIIVLGLILVSIVVIVRLLVSQNRNEK